MKQVAGASRRGRCRGSRYVSAVAQLLRRRFESMNAIRAKIIGSWLLFLIWPTLAHYHHRHIASRVFALMLLVRNTKPKLPQFPQRIGNIFLSGYALDDSTLNRQYWELWLRIIRQTNSSSMSGSRPTRPAGSISNGSVGRRVLCVRAARRERPGEMDAGGRCVRGAFIRFPPRPGPFSKTPARPCASGSGRRGQ